MQRALIHLMLCLRVAALVYEVNLDAQLPRVVFGSFDAIGRRAFGRREKASADRWARRVKSCTPMTSRQSPSDGGRAGARPRGPVPPPRAGFGQVPLGSWDLRQRNKKGGPCGRLQGPPEFEDFVCPEVIRLQLRSLRYCLAAFAEPAASHGTANAGCHQHCGSRFRHVLDANRIESDQRSEVIAGEKVDWLKLT